MFSINRFGQVLKALPRGAFERAVKEHRTDRHSKGFGSWQHLVVMVCGQLSGTGSLRQLEASYNQHAGGHYHLGAGPIKRSTLADANARRNPEVFADTVRALMAQAGRSLRGKREQLLYLLDSTSVPLVGRYLPAGTHMSRHGNHGMKLHVVYDAITCAPVYQSITPANVNDIDEGKKISIQAGATYVFDKGYCNYNWWHSINEKKARWVSRFKRDAALKEHESCPIQDADVGVILSDTVVSFRHKRPRGGHVNLYSGKLRRIEVARENDTPLVLATNDLLSPASEIARLYKDRWQIELFFKWIKQHLQVKRFLGTSENAVRIQLLIALIVYLLVSLHKATTGFSSSLWMLLAELRAGLFQRPATDQSWWQRRTRRMQQIAAVQPELFT